MTVFTVRREGDHTYPLPDPHPTFRMQYRFPQQFANAGQGSPLRPTRKGAGMQSRYLDYQGGPQHAPNQLTFINGLKGLSGANLGVLRLFSRPSTFGELRAQVRGVIQTLEANPTAVITITDVDGLTQTLPASDFAIGLREQFLEGQALENPDGLALPNDEAARYSQRMLRSIEEQALPWYRRRAAGVSLFGILATASIGASAYHGYRRNRSWGWAFGWGLLGAFFPIITPAVALAQGFGKRKKR